MNHAAGYVVFPGDSVDGHFVAEVAELEGGVETFVDSRELDFGGVVPFMIAPLALRMCENVKMTGKVEIGTFYLWSLG